MRNLSSVASNHVDRFDGTEPTQAHTHTHKELDIALKSTFRIHIKSEPYLIHDPDNSSNTFHPFESFERYGSRVSEEENLSNAVKGANILLDGVFHAISGTHKTNHVYKTQDKSHCMRTHCGVAITDRTQREVPLMVSCGQSASSVIIMMRVLTGGMDRSCSC